MLHNVLTYCREIGLKRVMVACEPWNVGSRKTILRNGGVYEKTVHEDGEDIDLEHYWISLTCTKRVRQKRQARFFDASS